ncbi:dihydrolipoyllysine-residue acetyltransferase [Pseudomonas sp. Irchel 3A7]|uniref:dihydrolipoyllysine-residue acetyltransferase n=1 Tax=Pseudomonas sp. Irchel 3A7 TaxID=2008913 RepID=UPI000BA35709|nr:dihydrolipoyllysine-residue acetyltransferase [Pseudomonas sp. Irchel 3A7]
MNEIIRVPNIGNGDGEVIELFVQAGDRIEAEQSILTLESDKASMEVPTPKAGVIKSLKVNLGDRLKEGDELIVLETEDAEVSVPMHALVQPTAPNVEPTGAHATEMPSVAAPGNSTQQVLVPDIGSSGKAQIIEIQVKVGDSVEADQSLITLESDKASMEIPSPSPGVVESLNVKLNDQIGSGDLILVLKVAGEMGVKPQAPKEVPASVETPAASSTATIAHPPGDQKNEIATQASNVVLAKASAKVHAGPAVRQLAREFGVDLSAVGASGPHGRILKEDVQVYVKAMMQKAKEAPAAAAGATSGAGISPIPVVDFSRFGEIEEVPMPRLMQVGAANLHRSWLNVPHVTQFDSADVTELEAFRNAHKAFAEKAGVKLTILPLLLKSCAHLLTELPDFNSSLAPNGKAIIRKKYVNIGFAVDTPDGLLVPVIKNVDQKSLLQLAAEAASLADKARTKKLSSDEMQGAGFTISSLGHIGGTGFTPIVNAPEVAILGVSKATIQPVWDGNAFQPKLMLPLSLSYDHRVINGAAAARFTKRLSALLGDLRELLM